MTQAFDEGLVRYLLEDAMDASDETSPKTKIYIVLSDTKSLFSKTVGLVTRQKYNHISLGFDRSLKKLYSFDLYTNSMRLETPEFFGKAAEFIAYSVEVTLDAFHRILNRIEDIYKH